jgi:phosphatidylglycerophosphatase A
MSAEKFDPVERSSPRGARRAISIAVATGFGLGYSPVASGTVGTLLGIGLVGLMQWIPGLIFQSAAALVLTIVAIPFCHDAEAVFARKDDGRIVADEYLTFPICMLGLPFTPSIVVVAFLTNRFFDILKPPPARALQRIEGGLGIVVDDVVAALYSLAANHAVFWLLIA